MAAPVSPRAALYADLPPLPPHSPHPVDTSELTRKELEKTLGRYAVESGGAKLHFDFMGKGFDCQVKIDGLLDLLAMVSRQWITCVTISSYTEAIPHLSFPEEMHALREITIIGCPKINSLECRVKNATINILRSGIVELTVDGTDLLYISSCRSLNKVSALHTRAITILNSSITELESPDTETINITVAPKLKDLKGPFVTVSLDDCEVLCRVEITPPREMPTLHNRCRSGPSFTASHCPKLNTCQLGTTGSVTLHATTPNELVARQATSWSFRGSVNWLIANGPFSSRKG